MRLDAPEVAEVAAVLAGAGRPLFVALQVDEVRFQHPAIRVPEVTVDDMVRLIRQAPSTTLVLNNLKVEHALPLMESGVDLSRVYLDTNAMDMPFDGLRTLVGAHGASRLVFGSQIPFLYPEAALMAVEQSGLRPDEIEGILHGNWQADPVLAKLVTGARAPASTTKERRDDQP